MNHPQIECAACGGRTLRRSRSGELRDLPKMLLGDYPFRCADCHRRSWINVWLMFKSKYARCPQCLSSSVVPRTHPPTHSRLWKKLLVTCGAHRYRCLTCHHRFLSVRTTERDELVRASADNLAGATAH